MIRKYPLCLIPKPYFRIINIDELLGESNDYYLLRRSSETKTIPFDEFGFLISKYFVESRKELPNLSLNILGYFKKPHIVFRSINYASQRWRISRFVNYFKLLKNIQLLENVYPIIIPFDRFHNVRFPYVRNDKEYLKKIPDELKSTHEPSINMRIEHYPNNSNFWHVQLDIKDRVTNNVNFKAKYGEGIYNHVVLNILSTIQNIDINKPRKVPKELFYHKRLYSIIKRFF